MENIYLTPEHETLREQVARFLAREVEPFAEQWERDGCVPREVLRKMGDAGLLGLQYESAYGGGEADARLGARPCRQPRGCRARGNRFRRNRIQSSGELCKSAPFPDQASRHILPGKPRPLRREWWTPEPLRLFLRQSKTLPVFPCKSHTADSLVSCGLCAISAPC